jgi:hypothetical protein
MIAVWVGLALYCYPCRSCRGVRAHWRTNVRLGLIAQSSMVLSLFVFPFFLFASRILCTLDFLFISPFAPARLAEINRNGFDSSNTCIAIVLSVLNESRLHDFHAPIRMDLLNECAYA